MSAQKKHSTKKQHIVFQPDTPHIALALAILSMLFSSLLALVVLDQREHNYTEVYVRPVSVQKHSYKKNDYKKSKHTDGDPAMEQVNSHVKVLDNRTIEDLKNQIDSYTGDRKILTDALVTQLYNAQILEGCSMPFNTDAPTTWQTYRNAAYGIEVALPYNEAWGNKKYMLNSYEEMSTSDGLEVHFGPIKLGIEDCGRWWREMKMTFESPVEAEVYFNNFIAAIANNQYKDEYAEPTLLNFGDVQVFYVAFGDECPSTTAVIFGEDYNYKITSKCGGLTLDQLGRMAQSIDFL